MENKTCGKCKYYDLHGGCNKIPDVLWLHSTNIACIKFDPKNPTNGDKIRQMSNEELADYLSSTDVNACAKDRDYCKEETWKCDKCWLEWLNSEVEE